MATVRKVVGSLAVLKTTAGSERYLHHGAIVGDGFKEESVEHAISVGLVAEVEAEVVDDGTGTGQQQEQTAEERYQALKVDELKAAIADRNEGRAEEAKVSADGKKDDLVAALLADDAKLAEQQNQQ